MLYHELKTCLQQILMRLRYDYDIFCFWEVWDYLISVILYLRLIGLLISISFLQLVLLEGGC